MRTFRTLLLLFLLLPICTNAKVELSQQDFLLLKPAFDEIDKGNLKTAHTQLLTIKKQVRADYARALALSSLAKIELEWTHYETAIPYLRESLQLKALPEDQQISLGHTLAQLYCVQEQWRKCIRKLKQWMQLRPGSISEQDYLMLAQAYSELMQWKQVIPPISAAISLRPVAPENWFQLKVAAYVQLKQWRQAVKAQRRLLNHYPARPDNWRNLVSLQLQNGQQKAALASQRMGYERGILSSAPDYRLLAQMLLQANIPFHAGKVLEKGLKTGILKPNKKTLRLLANCWISAREKKKAAAVLSRLHRTSPSNKVLLELATIQIQLQDWRSAQVSLKKLLTRSKRELPEAQLLLGIVNIKLKQFEEAQHALSVAAKNKNQQSAAKRWLAYLEHILPPAQPPHKSSQGISASDENTSRPY
ncbi:MAG: hypothetical protein CSB48_09315 [Proteobacteria bacterium]|nr:MAG: hypothetical protein CSB48_09315 [Pseudomonadota bacterium]PIE39977.1 MAG: hypothetical protein CSA51_03140 [Gammaproteobacteria bacterium]